MADCLNCENYAKCDMDKIFAVIDMAECEDYTPYFEPEKRLPKICKYCGDAFESTNRDVCERCRRKAVLLPQFKKARDDLRELCGLERMGDV